MKTRKRALSEVNSSQHSQVTAKAVKLSSSCSAELLRVGGYTTEPIPNTTTDILTIAVKAFQAQLEVLSKQPPQDRRPGFKQLARKQRLEFRVGDTALGQLGLLQGVAVTVQDVQSIPLWDNFTLVSLYLTGDCELRWCKP